MRTRRQTLGLSQEKLAYKAGINRTYIAEVEDGTRNVALRNVVKLARALEVKPIELLAGVDEVSRNE